MHIILKHPFKSFTNPFKFKISDFTVLTGINGSGKSQILDAIAKSLVNLTNDDNEPIAIGSTDCLYIPFNTLNPPDYNSVTSIDSRQQISNLWFKIKSYVEMRPERRDVSDLCNYIGPENVPALRFILMHTQKEFHDLTVFDVERFYPTFDNSPNLFNQNLGLIFRRYFDRREENQLNEFLRVQKGLPEYSYLTQEQFLDLHGPPPWETVNNLLAESQILFRVNFPTPADRHLPFELKLIEPISSSELKFADLSSGEKVIMSLIFALFTSQSKFSFPKILVMDEPDATLHPSMIKRFLQIIKDVFVKKHQVKVIMSTHSPATIALADESSLFQVNRNGPRIVKVKRAQALKNLNQNVPTFSVNFENRRQVFVESFIDRHCYEAVYDLILHKLNPEIQLSFIPSGKEGVGDCEQVKNIVNQLRRGGNTFVFGVIDHDLKNCGSDHVKILGDGSRYSLENFLFDPVIISAVILREEMNIKRKVGFNERDVYRNFNQISKEQLQIISDNICALVADKISGIVGENLRVSIFMGGNEINVPEWYYTIQGHELEAAIKSALPEFGKFKKGEDLIRYITKYIFGNFPEIIPMDFYNLFKSIQSA